MTRVCRACLQLIVNAECYSLNQSYPNSECSLLRDRCKSCVPEMDLDLTVDAVLCGSCYSTFTLFYNLRLKCLETEKKLKAVLREKNYVDLGAVVQQSQAAVDTISYLFNENESALPDVNVPNALNYDELTIKQEFESVDISSSVNVPEERSDFDSVFDRVNDVFEDSKGCGDIHYDLQDEKVESTKKLESNVEPLRKLNGSLHSGGSSDFMETKFTMNRSKKAFKCLDCDYSTSHRINLQKHIRSHFGNKPYKCNLCGYTALHKYFLKSHMTKHSSSKPFKCNQCDYKTAYRGNLQTHLRKHTGEKPFKCDICNKSYTQSNSLNRHIKTHANDKPYKCCMCEYRTTYKSRLRNHIMLHSEEKL